MDDRKWWAETLGNVVAFLTEYKTFFESENLHRRNGIELSHWGINTGLFGYKGSFEFYLESLLKSMLEESQLSEAYKADNAESEVEFLFFPDRDDDTDIDGMLRERKDATKVRLIETARIGFRDYPSGKEHSYKNLIDTYQHFLADRQKCFAKKQADVRNFTNYSALCVQLIELLNEVIDTLCAGGKISEIESKNENSLNAAGMQMEIDIKNNKNYIRIRGINDTRDEDASRVYVRLQAKLLKMLRENPEFLQSEKISISYLSANGEVDIGEGRKIIFSIRMGFEENWVGPRISGTSIKLELESDQGKMGAELELIQALRIYDSVRIAFLHSHLEEFRKIVGIEELWKALEDEAKRRERAEKLRKKNKTDSMLSNL